MVVFIYRVEVAAQAMCYDPVKSQDTHFYHKYNTNATITPWSIGNECDILEANHSSNYTKKHMNLVKVVSLWYIL